jgi:hypothetical protein
MLPSDIGWIGSLMRVAAMPVAYDAGRPLEIHRACSRGRVLTFHLPANARASELAPIIAELRAAGVTSLRAVAVELKPVASPHRPPRHLASLAGAPAVDAAQIGCVPCGAHSGLHGDFAREPLGTPVEQQLALQLDPNHAVHHARAETLARRRYHRRAARLSPAQNEPSVCRAPPFDLNATVGL